MPLSVGRQEPQHVCTKWQTLAIELACGFLCSSWFPWSCCRETAPRRPRYKGSGGADRSRVAGVRNMCFFQFICLIFFHFILRSTRLALLVCGTARSSCHGLLSIVRSSATTSLCFRVMISSPPVLSDEQSLSRPSQFLQSLSQCHPYLEADSC